MSASKDGALGHSGINWCAELSRLVFRWVVVTLTYSPREFGAEHLGLEHFTDRVRAILIYIINLGRVDRRYTKRRRYVESVPRRHLLKSRCLLRVSVEVAMPLGSLLVSRCLSAAS